MDGEAQVKTLGQIAFDAYQALDTEEQYKWESCTKWWQDVWESTAQAVRDAVIEECAKVCDDIEDSAWALWKTTADPNEQGRSIGADHCADSIRALKDKQ